MTRWRIRQHFQQSWVVLRNNCQLQHAIQIFIKIFDVQTWLKSDIAMNWSYYKFDYSCTVSINYRLYLYLQQEVYFIQLKHAETLTFQCLTNNQGLVSFLYQHTFEHKISTTWPSVYKTLYFVIFPNLTLIIFPSKLFHFMIIVYSNYW